MSDILKKIESMPPEKRRYTLQSLPTHLARQGRQDRLIRLLSTLGFLQAKLRGTGVRPLIDDYELAQADAGMKKIRSALNLSAHLLEHDSQALFGQLCGRLRGLGEEAVVNLLGQPPGHPWLELLQPSLTPAGASMQRTFSNHDHEAEAVVVHPDGERFASGADDGSMSVTDLRTGEILRAFVPPGASARSKTREGITSLVLLDDGLTLVSGSRSGAIRVWDINSGAQVRILTDQEVELSALAVIPGQRLVVSASLKGKLKVWDLDSGECIQVLAESGEAIYALAVLGNGNNVITGRHSGAEVWSLKTGESQSLAPIEQVLALAVGEGAAETAAVTRDGYLKVFDLEQSPPMKCSVMVSSDAAVRSVATLPGNRVVVGTWDGSLELWDAAEGRRIRQVTRDLPRINAIAPLPGGGQVLTAVATGDVILWSLEEGAGKAPVLVEPAHRGRVGMVCILPNGDRALSLGSDASLRVWDLDSRQEALSFELYDPVTTRGPAVMAALDDRHAIVGAPDGTVIMVELKVGGQMLSDPGEGDRITAIAPVPGGKQFVSATQWGRVVVRDRHLHKELEFRISDWNDHPSRFVDKLAVVDKRVVISRQWNGTVRQWDLETGKLLGEIPPELGFLASSAPEGTCIDWDRGQWRLWEIGTDAPLRVRPGPDRAPQQTEVSPDGTLLLSVDGAGLLQAWDLQNEVGPACYGADTGITACATSRCGRHILAGDESGRLHFLRLAAAASPCAPQVCVPQSLAPRLARWWWPFKKY